MVHDAPDNKVHMIEVAFLAGILQPPPYDHKADDVVNYGGIGAVTQCD